MFLGQRLVGSSEEFEMSVGVVKIILSKLIGFNIAVLKLEKSVSYQDYIQPVCLDNNNDRSFPVGSRCWVPGWGKGSKNGGEDPSSYVTLLRLGINIHPE